MLARLKLCQKPLDILTFGIRSATSCRSMNYWSNHANKALQQTGLPPLRYRKLQLSLRVRPTGELR